MQKEIVFNNPSSNGYILIEGEVMMKMNRYRQRMIDSKEAGGLLLGFRRGPHIEIIDITEPFSKDVRRRISFYRCDPLHEKYAKRKWRKSKNTIDYLGEWHTHPEQIPHPSSLDKDEWNKLTIGRNSTLAFLILGISGNWLGVGKGMELMCCKDVA